MLSVVSFVSTVSRKGNTLLACSMVCNRSCHLPGNPKLVWHPARLIKERGFVNLSMDTMHLKDTLVLFGSGGSALTLPLFIIHIATFIIIFQYWKIIMNIEKSFKNMERPSYSPIQQVIATNNTYTLLQYASSNPQALRHTSLDQKAILTAPRLLILAISCNNSNLRPTLSISNIRLWNGFFYLHLYLPCCCRLWH